MILCIIVALKDRDMNALRNRFLVIVLMVGTLCGCPFSPISPKEIRGIEAIWKVMGPVLGKIDDAVKNEPGTNFHEHVSNVYEQEYRNNEDFKKFLDFQNQANPLTEQGKKHTEKLFKSCLSGNLDKVKKAVAGGALINDMYGQDGSSPLTIAAHRGDFAMCKFLLEQGADPSKGTMRCYEMPYAAKDFLNQVDPDYIIKKGELVSKNGKEAYRDVLLVALSPSPLHIVASCPITEENQHNREQIETNRMQIAEMFLNLYGEYKRENGEPTYSAVSALERVTYDPMFYHTEAPRETLFGYGTPFLPEDYARHNNLFKLEAYFKKVRETIRENNPTFFDSVNAGYHKYLESHGIYLKKSRITVIRLIAWKCLRILMLPFLIYLLYRIKNVIV
jgi:Ankyrin repeat